MHIPLTTKIPKVTETFDYDWIAADRAWPRLEFEVTPEDVARWNAIFDDPDPWTTGPSPFGGPIAPPDIVYYVGQNAFPPRRDLNAVLADIALRNHAPLFVGRRLVGTTTIDQQTQRRGRAFVTWTVAIRDGETLVCETTRTWAFPLPDGVTLPERPSSRSDADGTELERIAPLSLNLSLERLTAFEGPGEHNGHTDPSLNPNAPGALAQGALSFGLACRLLRRRFGAAWFRDSQISLRLARPVYHGDEVTARAAILGTHGGSSCRIEVSNRAGEVTAAGSALVGAA